MRDKEGIYLYKALPCDPEPLRRDRAAAVVAGQGAAERPAMVSGRFADRYQRRRAEPELRVPRGAYRAYHARTRRLASKSCDGVRIPCAPPG